MAPGCYSFRSAGGKQGYSPLNTTVNKMSS